jgi:hypothetical protein
MQNTFVEYLGREEHNLLANFVKFKDEFEMFRTLDRIFQEPRHRLVLETKDRVVAQLFLFVHFCFYFSYSCMLRCHLSEAMSSIRKGIDATLSAYKIIKEPRSSKDYINEEKFFVFIKSNIKRNIDEFPLAVELCNIHESCSKFGSHADMSSFFHRLEIERPSEKDVDLLKVHYFQWPRNDDEFRYYQVYLLNSFYLMFKIFKVFLDRELRIIDPQWENAIKDIELKLGSLLNYCKSKIID